MRVFVIIMVLIYFIDLNDDRNKVGKLYKIINIDYFLFYSKRKKCVCLD